MKAKSQLWAHGLRGLTSTGVAVAASVAYVVLGGSLRDTRSDRTRNGRCINGLHRHISDHRPDGVARRLDNTASNFAARVRQTGLVRAIGASSSHMRQMLLKQAMTVESSVRSSECSLAWASSQSALESLPGRGIIRHLHAVAWIRRVGTRRRNPRHTAGSHAANPRGRTHKSGASYDLS